MLITIKIFCYILLSYGIANMMIYSNGPFHIFQKWRYIADKIGKQFGELFNCMLCLSTWIGMFLSIINITLLPNIPFTPFNIIIGSEYSLLTVVFDMGFTSGTIWILHQFEEMMERIGIGNGD